jgi:quinol monooxygenase YgiN
MVYLFALQDNYKSNRGAPVVTLVVHHAVRAYDAWKPVFDEHEAVRRAHGELEHRIYRFEDDPDRVVVHNDFPSEERLRAFMTDPSLPEAMERAGVVGEPNLSLLELTERVTDADAAAPGGAVVVIHHRVADADAWKTVFDGAVDDLRSHGVLEHRIYQDPGEPTRIVVHLDVPSRAAAEGLRDDAVLRTMLGEAGAIGDPGIGVAYLGERKVYAAAPA